VETANDEKDVIWLGDALSVLRAFPRSVRILLGSDLRRLQLGELPMNSKSMKSVGSGVRELRARDRNNQYRTIYVVYVGMKILVLHCFVKKSRVTPKVDIDTARRRLRAFGRK